MSRQNPLQPKSSLLEKNAKSRSGLQMVMIIVAVHVVFLGGLLFSGCRREEPQPAATGETNSIPTLPPMGEVAAPPTPCRSHQEELSGAKPPSLLQTLVVGRLVQSPSLTLQTTRETIARKFASIHLLRSDNACSHVR